MGFIRKIWQDRVSTFPNRRKIKDTLTNEEKIVLIERYEGDVSNSGTELSASSFNDLEVRIENAFIAEEKRINEEVIPSIENVNSAVSNLGSAISKGDSDTLVKANKYTDDKIGDVDLSGIAVNAEAIKEITSEETGILKQSKDYTDEKIGDVDLSGIATNAEAIEDINDADTGILKQSKDYTDILANGLVQMNANDIAIIYRLIEEIKENGTGGSGGGISPDDVLITIQDIDTICGRSFNMVSDDTEF